MCPKPRGALLSCVRAALAPQGRPSTCQHESQPTEAHCAVPWLAPAVCLEESCLPRASSSGQGQGVSWAGEQEDCGHPLLREGHPGGKGLWCPRGLAMILALDSPLVFEGIVWLLFLSQI